ncbi:MAG: NAD(P)(+) transhydrogenase (Re/Si-specific) subunit beta, partial [Gemmatimonadota bacterium]
MPEATFRETFIALSYLLSAVLFIIGLKRLQSPETARSGNRIAALGMLLAIVGALLEREVVDYTWIMAGLVIGGSVGLVMARTVPMTAMPQMVGAFNGFGGGASALVAIYGFLRVARDGGALETDHGVSIMAGTLIGTITFSGSMVAYAKLQGIVTGRAIQNPIVRLVSIVVAVGALAAGAYLVGFDVDETVYWGMVAASLVLGVLVVIPIGGADMPVVISLLNAYSGLAASAAGFVLNNQSLIISGALVGASGLILTNIMCRAMNRSLAHVLFSAFGVGAVGPGGGEEGERVARPIEAEDAAMLLGYANQVVFVPGYGLAVAQAQHKLRELADLLAARGVTVKYAIHPVAGRMPGHMNVLLAEANIAYEKLYDMEQINDDFKTTDVALVIGANDVTNPAARSDKSSPIYGMPI